MALIGKNNFIFANPIKNLGGQTLGLMRNNYQETGCVRNQYANGYSNYNATPRGYIPPYSWIMPQIGGGMATTALGISGSSSNSFSGALGLNGVASISGTGSITNADASLILYAVAALVGTGVISSADGSVLADIVASLNGVGDFQTPPDLQAIINLNASANLTGSGSLTASIEAITFLNAIAALTGSGVINGIDAGAIIGLLANLSGSASLSSTASALGDMTGDIIPYTELSPENLAIKVWSELLSTYETSGTAGNLLFNSGSGSSPELIAAAVWDYLKSNPTVTNSMKEQLEKAKTAAENSFAVSS